MKIFKGRISSYTLLLSIFTISSFYGNCCGEEKPAGKLEVVLRDPEGKTFKDSIFKGGNKAVAAVTEDMVRNFLQSPTDNLVKRSGEIFGAIRRYTQFGNPSRVLHVSLVKQLQSLLDQVLTHACNNECDYADYVVIVNRVRECVEYEKHRFEVALSEYNRAFRRVSSRSLLKRTIGLATSPYDVPSIIQIIEWIMTDLDELQARSEYGKGDFDVEHYKKVICYLQADLDTLFSHLMPLV